MNTESQTPTPWAVECNRGCNKSRPIFLTQESYDSQMDQPDSFWLCPRCGSKAEWSDEIYEAAMDAEARA